jgi:hypothetical protein
VAGEILDELVGEPLTDVGSALPITFVEGEVEDSDDT